MLVLGGCSEGTVPEPEATELPTQVTTPAPDAPAAAVKIVIGGTDFSIFFADDSTQVFTYASDPDVVVPALTAAFGAEPVITDFESGACSPATTRHAWGGFFLSTHNAWLPEGQLFEVSGNGETPLPVEATGGAQLLGEVDELYAATPDQRRFVDEESDGKVTQLVYLDVQDLSTDEDILLPDDTAPWGLFVFSTDGVIVSLQAPKVYAASGGC